MTKKTQKSEKGSPAFNFRTIKSYEDACKKQNHDPLKVPDISMIPGDLGKKLVAVFKIMMFYAAINNGWLPDYSNLSQAKYYPWPWVLSSGFGFSGSDYRYGYAFTHVGSPLCTDTSEKALYAFEQCKDLYQEWLL